MRTSSERRLITESPGMHNSPKMQAFIAKEASRPCKQWIHEVLSAKREVDRVKLRTSTFVLLPDVDCTQKRAKRQEAINPIYLNQIDSTISNPLYFWQGWERGKIRRQQSSPPQFHWLAVVMNTTLKTLRDLRGEHIPMLQTLHSQACQKISEECGIEPGQIMAYVHYPPSVYQLHVHFKHISGNHMFHDPLRVHPLPAIINNLRIDPDFYLKSHLQLPVYVHTELYAALGAREDVQNDAIDETLLDAEEATEKKVTDIIQIDTTQSI
jgi:hypothetical protein